MEATIPLEPDSVAAACLNIRTASGSTPLHLAASTQRQVLLKVLLAAGSDPNATSRSNSTPLHFAASVGRADGVEALLEAGADPHVRLLNIESTAIHCAAEAKREQVEIIELLLAKGATLNVQDKLGRTPLHLAAKSRYTHPKLIEAMLDLGADPGVKNRDGEYPADYAEKNQALQGTPVCQRLRQGITKNISGKSRQGMEGARVAS